MLAIVTLAWVCLSSMIASDSDPESFDLLIRGGRVFDGSGNPWFHADVGIRDGRIVALGPLVEADASVILDAQDLCVAPGFIDPHSHWLQRLPSPDQEVACPLLSQGVTACVINPDGGGPFEVEELRRRVDGKVPVHLVPMMPHGSIRQRVMGLEDRAPTDEELDTMKSMVRQGMEQGAFGLSSGLFYVPGCFAATEELIALGRVVSEYGGVYTSHIRDESNYTVGLLASVQEVIDIAQGAGIPGVITHVKALGPPVWGFSAQVISAVEDARKKGIEIYADQYPYEASATSLAAALLPRWAQENGHAAFLSRLDDPKTRDRIRDAMKENLQSRGGASRVEFLEFRGDPSLKGRTLEAIASEREGDPIDVALSLLMAGSPGIISHNMIEEDVDRFMNQVWTMTSSDGGSVGSRHPRTFGAFPRKLAHYARDRGVISIEDAIRSMTSLPARVFGLKDRGSLRVGAFADVAIFSLENLRDNATYREPTELSEGIESVIVEGELVYHQGQPTESRPGRVLRR